MDGLLEYKSFGSEVKDVDIKKRVVTGYLTSFGNKDYGGDIGVKGMFAKSINERKSEIFFLNQHNWEQPHGKFNVLVEDEKGLYFESTPLTDTSYSADALKLYEAGIMNEHSYGYQTINSTFDKKTNTRYLKEVKLFEGSNTTRGMNPSTPFTGFKSLMTLKEIDTEQKKLLKAFRTGTFTDETFSLIELALKQLQRDAYELGKKSLDIKEPLDINTPEIVVEPNIDEQKTIITNFLKQL